MRQTGFLEASQPGECLVPPTAGPLFVYAVPYTWIFFPSLSLAGSSSSLKLRSGISSGRSF